ncbi:hypothetical protein BAE44_0024924 [Dichanthelium oligosanthes]|uniref:HMA domain-containing protein n=1 Tax=Dichanthelium oligosanthes TaxID=888268 RepID=A0A1E5UMH0_9POAL|nr:hypothetical protein BAE44_0024924 [Dichanthelium oligosanthes]
MAAPEEGPEPLRYQTLALKVSIHCEGCKKKVKKVLHSIEGVYKTDIDTQQHKVVVIGNVSADVLVKKLLKTGKHAEPWPEPAPQAAGDAPGPGGSPGSGGKKKKKKSKNKSHGNSNKPADPAPVEGGSGPCPPEKQDKIEGGGSCDEAADGEHDKPEGGGAGDAHDGGAGGKVPPLVMTPQGPRPIAPAANGNGNGGGGGGKKKGKKGGGHVNGNGNANANGDGAGAGAGAIVEVHPPPDAPTKPDTGNSGPLTVVDAGPYPPPPSYPGYYAAGVHSPAYVMSYSTAHPTPGLRSSAYYHPMAGAAYTTAGGGGYFYSTAPVSAAPGSYYMFSEENANACRVM